MLGCDLNTMKKGRIRTIHNKECQDIQVRMRLTSTYFLYLHVYDMCRYNYNGYPHYYYLEIFQHGFNNTGLGRYNIMSTFSSANEVIEQLCKFRNNHNKYGLTKQIIDKIKLRLVAISI